MLLIRMLTLMLLLVLFVQDIKDRSVSWILFPILFLLLALSRWLNGIGYQEFFYQSFSNLAFLIFQLVAVNIYFSIKQRSRVNITNGMLGWGDILFLVTIAFYFPLYLFILFYLCSLFVVIVSWSLWKKFTESRTEQIPLAGLQAIFLTVMIIAGFFFPVFDPLSPVWQPNNIFQ